MQGQNTQNPGPSLLWANNHTGLLLLHEKKHSGCILNKWNFAGRSLVQAKQLQ